MKISALETAIDEAGREDVFSLAERNGWVRGSPVPEWLWWQFVRLVESRNK